MFFYDDCLKSDEIIADDVSKISILFIVGGGD
jgi:hypothetical protein